MIQYCDEPTYDIAKKCAWSCNICKAPSPPMCGPYRCCWNGKPPIISNKPNGKMCPPCADLASSHICTQFLRGCNTGQIRLRTYMQNNCYRTCNPGCN
ncbi:hypothetical protein AC249_AIPGENE775 [Exaiptasia diaphana]|nr:hypothetical protein AC249_AIPGENE775 [Exaiptasia diaphana]